MAFDSVIDCFTAPNPAILDDVRLLLAKAPGLTRYHRDRVGIHHPCDGSHCLLCHEGSRLNKASAYFVLMLKDAKVRVVLLDDREYSLKNRRTKRTFLGMLKSASPEERQFIPSEYGIVRLKNLAIDVPVEESLANWIVDFSAYADDHPDALLEQYFYFKS